MTPWTMLSFSIWLGLLALLSQALTPSLSPSATREQTELREQRNRVEKQRIKKVNEINERELRKFQQTEVA